MIKTDNETNNQMNYWCLAGVGAGLLLGAAANLYITRSFFEKSRQLCLECYSAYPPLEAINNFKQIEYRKFSLIAPFAPLAINLVSTACRERKVSAVTDNAKKMATKHLACALLAISMTFISRRGIHMMRDTLKEFDISGHSMLKVCLTFSLMQTLATRQNLKRSPLEDRITNLFTALVIATDAVQMFNTAIYCHTVAEIAVGVGIAALIQASSRATVSCLSSK